MKRLWQVEYVGAGRICIAFEWASTLQSAKAAVVKRVGPCSVQIIEDSPHTRLAPPWEHFRKLHEAQLFRLSRLTRGRPAPAHLAEVPQLYMAVLDAFQLGLGYWNRRPRSEGGGGGDAAVKRAVAAIDKARKDLLIALPHGAQYVEHAFQILEMYPWYLMKRRTGQGSDWKEPARQRLAAGGAFSETAALEVMRLIDRYLRASLPEFINS